MSSYFGVYSQLFAKLPVPSKSFAGQTVIVTGGNSGLGKEAARHITRLGAAKVILGCRSLSTGEEAKASIEESTQRHGGVVEVWPLDLGDYGSTREFAARASGLGRLDAVLLNAGISRGEWEVVQGHESQIAINVISTMYLALLLLPVLDAATIKHNTTPRLCVVTSGLHGETKLTQRNAEKIFEELNAKERYERIDRYKVSKLLEVLTTKALVSRRGEKSANQHNVVIDMVDPGFNKTGLNRTIGGPIRVALEVLKFFLGWPAEKGSRNLVYAVEDWDAETCKADPRHGKYIDTCQLNEGRLNPLARGKDGARLSARVLDELLDVLEPIHPGIKATVW